MPQLIPLEIEENEELVRCIGHELYFSKSKNRITSTAFMPPPRSNEVSLLRLNYSDEHKCKAHAKSIRKNNYEYCGLSKTLAMNLKLVHDDYMIDEATRLKTSVKASPLDENKKLRSTGDEVTTGDPGLPYHADLVYNWTPQEGKTAPSAVKRLATKLSKNPPTEYFSDVDIESEEWTGPPLKN